MHVSRGHQRRASPEAKKHLEREVFDIAILDILVMGVDGYTALGTSDPEEGSSGDADRPLP